MEGYFLLIYMQGLMPETRIGIAARVGAIRASLESWGSSAMIEAGHSIEDQNPPIHFIWIRAARVIRLPLYIVALQCIV